jgi:DNA polymerase V
MRQVMREQTELPLVHAPAGFPSPAEDYADQRLDLNGHLVKNPAASYFIRVDGDSMRGAGITSGDLLVVDRSIEPRPGHVVVAAVDGELTVKRLKRLGGGLALAPENPDFAPIPIDGGREVDIWGVATFVIHKLTGGK